MGKQTQSKLSTAIKPNSPTLHPSKSHTFQSKSSVFSKPLQQRAAKHVTLPSNLLPSHTKQFYSRSVPPRLGHRVSHPFTTQQTRPVGPNRNLPHPITKPNEKSHTTTLQKSSFQQEKNNRCKTYRVISPKTLQRKEKQNIFSRLIDTQREQKIIIDSNIFNLLFNSKQNRSKAQNNLKSSSPQAREFTNEFISVCTEVDYSCTGFLNYSQFCSVLNKLRFIRDSFNKSEEERQLVLKAWKLLCGLNQHKVKISSFYLFLLGVMKFPFKINSIADKNTKSISQRSEFALSQHDISLLHHDFICFYLARTDPQDYPSIRIQSLSSSPEETLSSHSENPDLGAANTSEPLLETSESLDAVSLAFPEPPTAGLKFIKRVSLRDLAAGPPGAGNSWLQVSFHHHPGQSSSETPKNMSFCASEAEENSAGNQLLSPSSQNEEKNKRNEVKRVATMRSENETSKTELNKSVSYKQINVKFRFPQGEENSADVNFGMEVSEKQRMGEKKNKE
jgi:hypothetical protein